MCVPGSKIRICFILCTCDVSFYIVHFFSCTVSRSSASFVRNSPFLTAVPWEQPVQRRQGLCSLLSLPSLASCVPCRMTDVTRHLVTVICVLAHRELLGCPLLPSCPLLPGSPLLTEQFPNSMRGKALKIIHQRQNHPRVIGGTGKGSFCVSFLPNLLTTVAAGAGS